MQPTIVWYREHLDQILPLLPPAEEAVMSNFMFHQAEGASAGISEREMQGIIAQFPASARQRSNLELVELRGPRWFHRDSLNGAPKMTDDIREAISPMAFIPSMVHGLKALDPTRIPSWLSVVTLFQIPVEAHVSADVARIIHAQGFAHEYAHTIVTPEIQVAGLPPLVLPEQDPIDPFELFVHYFDMIEAAGPISHYASAYFTDGKFSPGNNSGLTALNEQTVESIVAHLFGFAFRTDGQGLAPFEGRDALAAFVDTYLAAHRG